MLTTKKEYEVANSMVGLQIFPLFNNVQNRNSNIRKQIHHSHNQCQFLRIYFVTHDEIRIEKSEKKMLKPKRVYELKFSHILLLLSVYW